jgi:hypothetical protein
MDKKILMIILRDLCINRNNHQKPTFHPLGNFLNPALALLGQGLKKSPIGQKLDSLIRQKKGVKHAKIYAIDLRTKIPYLPTEQTRI